MVPFAISDDCVASSRTPALSASCQMGIYPLVVYLEVDAFSEAQQTAHARLARPNVHGDRDSMAEDVRDRESLTGGVVYIVVFIDRTSTRSARWHEARARVVIVGICATQ